MFKLFEEKDESKFTWDSIGEVKVGRSNLGLEMPVFVYRLFQFTIKDELSKRFGKDVANDIFRNSGFLAGKEFANNVLDLELGLDEFIADLQQVLEINKIGILRVELLDLENGHLIVTIDEDLDCSGLPITNETVCTYDEGFLTGILQVYTKENFVVKEIDCWATGARVCRFEGKVERLGSDA
ncbi:MAG: V4R domain-containing protein [Lachnospirales bacterium]